MSERLTLRAYARHRAELGLPGRDHKAVSKAIATGRITGAVGDDGLIDPELADQLWAERTRTAMPAVTATPPDPPPAADAAAREAATSRTATPPDGKTPPADHAKMYAEGRARLTLAKAASEELDLAERRGELVPLEVHERRIEAGLLRIVNVMDSLPGSWPPRLAMCKSLDDFQHAVKQMVRELKDELFSQADAIDKESSDLSNGEAAD